jgi:hypothetical protein
MLQEVGIEDAHCWRLQVPEGKKLKRRPSRSHATRNLLILFYDDGSWADGCEVHDWVLKINDGEHKQLVSLFLRHARI